VAYVIYMLCDGRWIRHRKKILGLELGRTQGLDTSDAYHALGLEQDPRHYDRVGAVLQHFGIRAVRLLTNNPRKIGGLEAFGIPVTREPLEIPATDGSRPYLQTKQQKMGHLLTRTVLRSITLAINSLEWTVKEHGGPVANAAMADNTEKAAPQPRQ
jgi:GTP cyclohydrolase II